jgi:hypothetical protein
MSESSPREPHGRLRAVALVVIVLAGLLAGAGIALAVTRSPASNAAAGSSTTPSASAPVAAPASSAPGSTGGFRMLFLGHVTAYTGDSITLSAQGHTVTAAIDSSTQVTGHPKVGDTVSAQITQDAGGKYVATAIQDPAGQR